MSMSVYSTFCGAEKVRKMYRENSGNRFNRPPREMHKAICADCSNETEVPFKPTEGRPVYCRECFRKHRTTF